MSNRYYKRYEITKDENGIDYYRPPSWIKANFEGIEAREIIWQEGDRLDVLAEQIYGDPSLWKVLALFNGVGYIFDIKPGYVISLPLKIKDLLDRI